MDLSRAEIRKTFREGEAAAEAAYGPLPDEPVPQTMPDQCPYPVDTEERWWWWTGYARYKYLYQATCLKKQLTSGYETATEQQVRINELQAERDRAVRLLTEEESVRYRLEARIAELEARMGCQD